ncbi:CPBP family intramembrane glutamic endopeptidase [Streptococcus peroris]|uniref:CAAX amino terminal protease family protein n=1 Tax=Streptococcus peroris ATCC 700780 TaxID=888746 RepID=E8KA23_9STRE|nr:CPBP family intramembrane glutamic endopeptidase [Streptococcus peroris]EFX40944.1 CAAX amino terminal protease family protein [Streptococcus peroris ATCC 700780]
MNFFKDYRKRLIWLGIFFVAIFLSQVPMLTLVLLQKTQLESIWSTVIVGITSTAVVTLFLYGAHKSKLLNLKSKLFTINDAPRIALSYVAIIVGNMIGAIWLHLLKQTTTSNQETINSLISETSLISSFFVIVIVAPLCEEIICRGIIPTKLFEGYEKIGYIFGWLLFTIAHMPNNLPSFLIYGWMSAVLTWTAYRTKRLEMSILLHLVNNGVSILLLILLTFLIKVVGIDAFQ